MVTQAQADNFEGDGKIGQLYAMQVYYVDENGAEQDSMATWSIGDDGNYYLNVDPGFAQAWADSYAVGGGALEFAPVGDTFGYTSDGGVCGVIDVAYTGTLETYSSLQNQMSNEIR